MRYLILLFLLIGALFVIDTALAVQPPPFELKYNTESKTCAYTNGGWGEAWYMFNHSFDNETQEILLDLNGENCTIQGTNLSRQRIYINNEAIILNYNPDHLYYRTLSNEQKCCKEQIFAYNQSVPNIRFEDDSSWIFYTLGDIIIFTSSTIILGIILLLFPIYSVVCKIRHKSILPFIHSRKMKSTIIFFIISIISPLAFIIAAYTGVRPDLWGYLTMIISVPLFLPFVFIADTLNLYEPTLIPMVIFGILYVGIITTIGWLIGDTLQKKK